jgi:cytochrome c oxidase assembly protein subunit 11
MKRFPLDPNMRVALAAATGALVMVGAAFAAVPLYDLFCRITGYGGTTRVAEEAASRILDREMEVRFDSNTAPGLPWDFEPLERSVTLNVGQSAIAYYRATNTSDVPVTGMASFNVTPFRAGQFFYKIECFCFTEQTLQPGESIEMPVMFFVDPDIADYSNLDDVRTMTLSYTFHETDAETQTAGASGANEAAPSP